MDEREAEDRVWFYGSWKEFAPIAFTNLLLTIITLGVYRFWATNRERHYLWSKTALIDEELAWTGTGKELLLGFLMAVLLLGGPLIILNFGIQALIARNHHIVAGIAGVSALLLFNYVIGVAKMRALRFRLSRTFWRGIRGGSDNAGWRYGFSNLWKWGANYLSLGLAIPWTMVTLWNDRWRAMSFGTLSFKADATVKPILMSFFLFYLVPLLLAVLVAVGIVAQGRWFGNVYVFMDAPLFVRLLFYVGMAFAIYWFIGIIFLNYYATFYREAVAQLSLGDVRFRFEASAGQWMTLYLVDAALVVGTLGLGWMFLGYRHWKFFIDHLAIEGDIDRAALGQSTTTESRHGEGLLDAIDVGAF